MQKRGVGRVAAITGLSVFIFQKELLFPSGYAFYEFAISRKCARQQIFPRRC